MFRRYYRCCSGTAAIEYAFIAAFISIMCISGARMIGIDVVAIFDEVLAAFSG